MALAVLAAIWASLMPGVTISAVEAGVNNGFGKQETYSLNEERRSDTVYSARVEGLSSRALSAEEPGEEGAASVNDGSSLQYVVNLEFRSPAAREKAFPKNGKPSIRGTHKVAVFERFADVFVASEEVLSEVFKIPGLFWVDVAGSMIVPPPPPADFAGEPSRAVPDKIVRNGYSGLKGKGIIVAIVDSGVDFRHPDFVTYDEQGRPTSRLLYLWDTGLEFKEGRGQAATVDYPSSTPIGTVFTKADLTEELRSKRPTIPSTDRDGHGTACASVSVGNGNADKGESGLKRTEVIGVAPEADIIAVSLDVYRNAGFSGSFLINAVAEWLDDVAGAKPLVISNSWGGNGGGHDGQSVLQRHLGARFPEDTKGRALLFAAGNEGSAGFHAVSTLKGNGGQDQFEIGIRNSWVDKKTGKPLPVTVRMYAASSDTNLRVAPKPLRVSFYTNPITRQDEAHVTFAPGTTSFLVWNDGKNAVQVDLYMNKFQGLFRSGQMSNRSTVASPGSMRSAITIGSYDWNDNFHRGGTLSTMFLSICTPDDRILPIGDISCYSSVGPTRDGRTKPEIGAPGQWFTSSLSSGVLADKLRYVRVDSTGMYRAMNGTSAATPYVAGVIALMFEKKADLTIGEIRDLLMVNASKDPFTSVDPGPEWGAGKLNYAAVQKIFAALDPQ